MLRQEMFLTEKRFVVGVLVNASAAIRDEVHIPLAGRELYGGSGSIS
jgi:hypothetical protein